MSDVPTEPILPPPNAPLISGAEGFTSVVDPAVQLRPHLERLGAYTIIRLVGAGGMGLVYEAEQQHPQRRVALKVIRPMLVTRPLLRRFELEAEVLGRLEHPGIARVYEAGTAQTGAGPTPFFAMELVRGRPLDEYT